MAKGVTKSTTFKPGDPRAVAAGKKSSRALPLELKEARRLNANKVEEILYKYMDSTADELLQAMQNPLTPAIELVVIKVLKEAIKNGDHHRLDFLLNRTIGKVPDKTLIAGQIGVQSIHDVLIRVTSSRGEEESSS